MGVCLARRGEVSTEDIVCLARRGEVSTEDQCVLLGEVK